MLNGKYISLDRIMEMIPMYTIINPDDIQLATVVEGIGHIFGLIGIPDTFETTSSELEVVDYRVAIPLDLIKLEVIRDADVGYILTRATDKLQVTGEDSFDPGFYTYKENNGYYYFNFEEGDIEIIYTRFITDSNGFPMIPEDMTWQMAIMWGIVVMAAQKLWAQGQLADKVFTYYRQQKNFYIDRAQRSAKMPDMATMNNVMNGITRLFPINTFDNAFAAFNIPSQKPVKNTR